MKHPLTLATLLIGLLTSACSSPPSRFYTLAPISNPGAAKITDTKTIGTLGIGPVELPKSLDRPELMTRSSLNEFNLDEYNRWAEPLDDAFTQVLAENLTILLPVQRVLQYPWEKTSEVDYQVKVAVIRFDRTINSDANLRVRWSIRHPGSETDLITRSGSYQKTPKSQDPTATVEAMNHLLADFSRDVATAIKTLQTPQRH